MNQNFSSVLAYVSYLCSLDGRMRLDKLFSLVHASLRADQSGLPGFLLIQSGPIFSSPT